MKQADIAKLKDDPMLFCETFFEETIPDFSKEMLAMLNKRLKPCNKFVCPPRRFPKLPSFMETRGCDLPPGTTGVHKDGVIIMIDECGIGGITDEIRELIEKAIL